MNKILKDLREQRIANKNCRRYEQCKEDKNAKDKFYLTIADGDFAYADSIRDDVMDEVSNQIMAYQFVDCSNYDDVSEWYQKHWNVNVTKKDSLIAQGVLYWIHVAINQFSSEGDGILLQNPVYDPFLDLIRGMDRKVVDSPLIYKDGRWEIDFDDLDKKLAKSKIMLLCSPHNPTGNVWTKEEMNKISELTRKHNVLLLVDEIWQDVVFSDAKFTHSLELEDQSNVVHIGSPTKTYNLGGLHYGIMTAKNEDIFKQMEKSDIFLNSCSSNQPWIIRAVKSCYTNEKSHEWKHAYLEQLEANRDKLMELLGKYSIEAAKPEGTYLLWAELGNDKLKGEVLTELLDKKYNLVLTAGDHYGQEYAKWVRLNFAISEKSMNEVLTLLEDYLKNDYKI